MSAKQIRRAADLAEIARWEKVAYFDRDAERRSEARDHLCVLRQRVAVWSPDRAMSMAEAEEGGACEP